MYELIQVAPRTWFIDCPAKMGIYLENETDVWLIDSGNDKDAGKKVQKILAERGWNLKAIICTHFHADHIGGNKLLQDRLHCVVYAKGIEQAVAQHPILEPSLLYGGFPCKPLRNKFLMAQESCVTELSEASLPSGMEIIDLPGHSFQMVGVKTPDKIYFLADCLTSEDIVRKYHVSFLCDPAAYLNTLSFVETLNGIAYIPAHAEMTSDIVTLARINRDKVLEIKEWLISTCQTPCTFEEILQRLFTHYNLRMDCNQYVLIGSTIRSYLSWLQELKLVEFLFSDNRMLWSSVENVD